MPKYVHPHNRDKRHRQRVRKRLAFVSSRLVQIINSENEHLTKEDVKRLDEAVHLVDMTITCIP